MCVRIRRSAEPSAPWDAESLTINVPEHLDDRHALRHVRLILAELGKIQPEMSAVCYCGDPVYVRPRAGVARRVILGEVATRGA